MAEKPKQETPSTSIALNSVHLSVLRELATFGASEEDLFTPEERTALNELFCEKFVQRAHAVFRSFTRKAGDAALLEHTPIAEHPDAVPFFRIGPRGVKELMIRNRGGRLGKI